MATALLFDPGTVNSSAVAPYTLGGVYSDGSRLYQCIQLTDAVNGANGMVVEAASTTSYIVTVDRAGGSSLGRIPRGVLVGTITAGNYGFALIYGIHSAVKDAANALTAAVKVTTHATTDGDSAPATAYTDKIIGVCLANASGGSAPVFVQIGA